MNPHLIIKATPILILMALVALVRADAMNKRFEIYA